MADTKISALTAVTAIAGANEFAVNETGVSKKASADQLRSFVNPAWEGNIAAASGDGNPNLAFALLLRGNSSPTPTNITTSVARISYFRLRTALTVNKIRYYGRGVTTDVHRIAIYNGDTLARVMTETAFTTASSAWGGIGSGLGLVLAAGQLYFIAVAVNATGTTAGVMAYAAPPVQVFGTPKGWPGNLDVDAGYVSASYAQGAVTSGALPDPFPTVAAAGAWSNGMPAFFLDNSNA